MRSVPVLIIVAMAAAVSGCSSKGLMDLRTNSRGPDEFLVLPSKPLTVPENLAALPAPTPGAANRTDQNPTGDAVAALGGNPATLNDTAVPAADAALVAQASRYGVPGNIRTTLAEADAKFRDRQRRGTRVRLFPVDRYSQAYRRDKIDPFQQTRTMRNSGLQTPTSPPERD